MTTYELKKYIYENNKVEDLLEEIKCGCIVNHGKYITASNINGDNSGAIVIYLNDYLDVIDYTRNFGDKSDIFDLVAYNLKIMGKKYDFYSVIKFIHSFLGLKIENSYKSKELEKNQVLEDDLKVFTRFAAKSYKDYEEEEIKYIERNEYIPLVHIDFFREGIIKKTIKKFDLGYSYYRNRTIIPIKYWMNGKLVGYNARSSVKNCEEFGIRKYMITKDYQKSMNLYGLWENKKEIEKKKIVIIFEAEKSVLKMDSLFQSYAVALQGHNISREQVKIILSLDVSEIVIAMDNDVDINEIRNMCDKFYGLRSISYIKDRNDMLGEKDSPIDKGWRIYKKLFKERINYNYKEHFEYLKCCKENK